MTLIPTYEVKGDNLVISHLGEWENAEPIKPYGQ